MLLKKITVSEKKFQLCQISLEARQQTFPSILMVFDTYVFLHVTLKIIKGY